jgi:RHS repeat-associated protein
MGLAVLAAIVTIAAGAMYASARMTTLVDEPLVYGDTVVVFGPYTADDPGSNNEEFELEVKPGHQYLLKVENGLPDGSRRMTAGYVRLHGYKPVPEAEVALGGAGWMKRFLPLDTNWVRVQIDAPSDAIVKVSVLETIEPTVTFFETRVEATSTTTATREFHELVIPSGLGAPFYLCSANGNIDGTNQYVNVRFFLDGVEQQPNGFGAPPMIALASLSSGDSLEVRGAADALTDYVDVCVMGTDIADPALTLATPTANLVTRDSLVTVSGTVLDSTATVITVNGVVATLGGGNSWSAEVPIVEGPNTLAITAIDAAGNQSDTSRVVHRDETPPDVTITLPVADGYTLDTLITLVGTATDASTFTLNVNGTPVTVDENGDWSVIVAAPNEVNVYVVTATDVTGNAGSAVRIMGRDLTDPTVTVTEPVNHDTTEASSITVTGTVVDSSAVVLTVNGDTVAVTGGAFEHMVPLLVGTNTVLVIATDVFGNQTTVSRTVVREESGAGLPPEPSAVAPALNPALTTNLHSAMEFLWTGATPIQTGVAPGTIVPKRVTVLRGKVLDREADPLSGATVRIVNHPEYGETKSRATGLYDMAVNGGGPITVEVEKSGYFTVQRTISAPWQAWTTLDSIVLTPMDTNVTTIDFADSIEVARGSVVSDSAGTRRGTLLFRQGTVATLVLPNGSIDTVAAVNVRITEYTTGPLGLEAMPGELPAATAYTYAAELSTDEAMAAGAREVKFTLPVSYYVENFLGIPVGSIVPLGYYDRDRAAWKPEPDGRVVKIVSVTGNRANIAVAAAGTAASQAVLDSMGFTDAERGQLASLYSVGTELTRIALTHFSAIDGNYSNEPPPGATPPNIRPDRSGEGFDQNSACQPGSIIGCQNQTLGEVLGITGVPYTLHYSSERTPAYRPDRRIVIPEQHRVDTAIIIAAGGTAGRNGVANVARMASYALQVAGREMREGPIWTSAAFPGVTLEWDGLDGAGRRVLGEQPARLVMEYGYQTEYTVLAATSASPTRTFGVGLLAGMDTSGVVRRNRRFPRTWDVIVGNYDARVQGLGGWTLSVHHQFNPATGTLHQGDGRKRSVEAIGQTLAPLFPDNTGHPNDIAVAPDGTFYLAWGGSSPSVHRYSATGASLGRIAGLPGSSGYSGEEVRADSSRLTAPNAVAIGPDGRLYIADGHRIRRVDADGRLRTIIGTDVAATSPSPEGRPGDSTAIRTPRDLAFLPDGSLLFIEDGFGTIRRFAPNGIVSRFAGTGTSGYNGDGEAATSAQISTAYSQFGTALATGPDGSAYLSHLEPGEAPVTIVRRIRPDGVIETVAGRRDASTGPTPARQHFLFSVRDLIVRPNGELLISQGATIVGVGSDGSRRIVAGTSERCSPVFCSPSNPVMRGLAQQVRIDTPSEMVLDPSGRLVFDDADDDRIRIIAAALPGFDQNDIAVASEDGGAVFQFDQYGRHLRTLDALSRDTVLTFGYDSLGYLTSLADADGEVTTIERSGATAMAIVGPDGQRTELSLDANGYLDEIENPAGELITLVSSSNGLLQSLTDPRGHASVFTYDALGRLVKDSSAANRVQTLARVQTDTSSTVTITDDLGRSRAYRLDRLGGRFERRTVTDAAGLATVSTTFEDDSTVTIRPDGSRTKQVATADSRFGPQSPVLRSGETRLPSGLTSVVTLSRTATLSSPADPLSLDSLVDLVNVNSRQYRSVYKKSTRTLLTTSPMGRTTTTVYDTAGRVVSSTVPGIQAATFSYDAHGRLTQAQNGGRISTFAYDAEGRLLSTTDPVNRRDSLFYDDADRLTRRKLPDGREVTFAYDSTGNLTSVDPPGKPAHTFTYAPADRLAMYNPPTNGLGTSATSYGYNTAGQVTVIRRPTADSISLGYDAAGRPSSVAFDRGTIGFTYNGTTGNLTSLSAPGGLGLAFTYDGSLPTSVTWSGTVTGSTAVTYNTDFRVTNQTVNGSHGVSFGYDLDGLLTSAGALGLRRAANNGRLDADSLTVGGSTQKSGYGYDAHGTLSAMVNTRGNDTLFTTSYVRDSLSRITQLTERVNGTTQVAAFTYDSVGRLSTVTRNSVLTASYTYDLNGNRATKMTSGGTETAVVDDQDRLTSYGGASYEYTNNGELRRKIAGTDTTEYTYDALGNLTEVELPDGTEIGYLIDAQNRRIGKTVNGTLVRAWLYQGQLTPTAELDGSGNVVSRFIQATGVNVPDYMVRGDSIYRLIRDHLGSVRVVLNIASGSVAQRLAYDEFGIMTENTNPDWQPFGYAGGLTDGHTGLIRFGARDYDPVAGRWTAKDPIGFAGGTVNLYQYAHGDAINYHDPFGLCPECMTAAGVSVLSTMAGPAFDAINPGGYVVSNPIVRINAVALYVNLADQRGNEGFEFQVTGGDRYECVTSFDDGNGGGWRSIEHRSSTNHSVIDGSSSTSPHLEQRGARALDLRIRGVDDSAVNAAIRRSQFSPSGTRRGYPDGHTHVALPNQPQFNRPNK